MMETIFGWALSGVNALLKILLTTFTNVMSLDLGTIVDYFPFLATGFQMFRVIGIGLAAIFAVISISRFFRGEAGRPRETPTSSMFRLGGSIAAIYFGGHLINMAVEIAKYPYQAFIKLSQDTDALMASSGARTVGEYVVNGMQTVITNIGNEAGLGLVIGAGANILFSLILMLAIGWSILKLVIEICERYLMVGVLAYASPLAFSTIAAEETSTTFKRWCSMFFGQLLLMTLSVWSYDIVLSGLTAVTTNGAGHTFIRLLMVFAACRVGMRVDSYMQQLGIGVATTGGSLLDETVGVFRTISAFAGGKSHGGQDGTGHREDSVLGGSLDSRGRVRPEAFGAGVLGSTVTGAKYAADAFRHGDSVADIARAAKDGAIKGFGVSKNPDGSRDLSFFVGRRANQSLENLQKGRREARSAEGATQGKFGTAVKSGDNSRSHLNQTAQQNGLKLGKGGVLSGTPSVSGGFMAANFGKESAHDILSNTAKQGDPTASEQALFGVHNDLKYDEQTAEVSKAAYDQLGSDMMVATMGEGMQGLDRKAASGVEMSQAERNVMEAGAAMASAMDGDGNIRMKDFHAGQIGEKIDSGRMAMGTLVDEAGHEVGTITMLDDKAYNSLSESKKEGFVPMTGSSGATYYTRASGVTPGDIEGSVNLSHTGAVTPLDLGGAGAPIQTPKAATTGEEGPVSSAGNITVTQPETPPASGIKFFSNYDAGNPSMTPDASDAGVELTRMDGKTVIRSDDSYYAGAAVNEGLNSHNMAVQQVAKDTVSSPAMTKDVAEAALFSQKTDGIRQGNDQAVASMMGKVFGDGAELSSAVGSVMEAGGAQPIIPPEDVRHFGDALKKAAAGETDESGYTVSNLSSDKGVVSCDFHTPTGESYRVQTMMADTAATVGFEGPSADVADVASEGQYKVGVSRIGDDGPISTTVHDAPSGGDAPTVSQPSVESSVEATPAPVPTSGNTTVPVMDSTVQPSVEVQTVAPQVVQGSVEIPAQQVEIPTQQAVQGAVDVSSPQVVPSEVVGAPQQTAIPTQYPDIGIHPGYEVPEMPQHAGKAPSAPSGPYVGRSEQDDLDLSEAGKSLYDDGEHPDFTTLGKGQGKAKGSRSHKRKSGKKGRK